MFLLQIFLIVAYPVAVQLAILTDVKFWHGIALVVLLCSMLYPALINQRWWAWLLLPVAGLGIWLLLDSAYAMLPLYAVPVLLNVAVGWLFARTLRPNKTPLITQIAIIIRHDGDNMPPAITRYTHQITWSWVVVLWGLAAVNALLAMFASAEVWAWFANVINYCIIAAMFPLEWLYRYCFYQQYEHPSLRQFITGMRRIDWKRLS